MYVFIHRAVPGYRSSFRLVPAASESLERGLNRSMTKDFKKKEQSRNMVENMLGVSKMVKLTDRVVATLMISGKTFASLNRTKQVVGEVYRLQQAMGLLPDLKEKPKKSNEEAQKLRIKGNQAYKAKEPKEALRLYTRAICWAESEGEEIAMAYANRSAVTYELHEYRDSIEDINRALSTGKYPRNLTQKLIERRGKCFLALGQYTRAVEEFKQAMTCVLQTDINARKLDLLKAYLDLMAQCLGKQDLPMKQTVKQPELTHKPSSYIQCASEAVDIRFSPEMGRHIVASVDIAPGDILAIEKPFASVITRDLWDLFCGNCKRKCYSAIPCPSCNDVVFCSEICRETSWAAYHSVECEVLHHLINLGCSEGTMLAVQTLLKATKLGKNLQTFMDDCLNKTTLDASSDPEKAGFVDNVYLSDHYKAIHSLITNEEHLSQEQRLLLAAEVSSLIHVLKEASTFFEHTDNTVPSARLFKPVSDLRLNHIVAANLLMRYIMVAASNGVGTSQAQWESDGDERMGGGRHFGAALYSFLSLHNHSCYPDVSAVPYNGDGSVIFAVKPITKGQEIFVSYTFNYATDDKLERQMRLRTGYYFTCKCIACLEDWPVLLDMPDENPMTVSKRAKKSHALDISESCRHVPNVIMAAREGKMTEEHFRFLVRHLTLTHKYVKRPGKMFWLCQLLMLDYLDCSFNSCIR